MIPIKKPFLGEKEVAAVSEVILSGWITQGPKVRQFEEAFASYVGAKYACAVSSCTTALHLALLTAGVEPGDVVITVSHSYIASANVIRHCGAEPVFIDIDPDNFNMSPSCLRKCLFEDCVIQDGQVYFRDIAHLAVGQSPIRYISQKSRKANPRLGRIAAIMPVHQMGMPCDLRAILNLANKFKIPVVEDAACAVGSEVSLNYGKTWKRIGKPHGLIACFSFHPRKIITTGDGGMIVTNNREFDRKFRLLRHQGMSVSDVERHGSKKVIIENYPILGYNYRMTDVQAAIGIEQLKKILNIINSHKKINRLYHKHLKEITWLKLPEEPSYARSNWQSYAVRILPSSPISRNALMQYLLDKGIANRPGIMNAHQEKAYSGLKHHLEESEIARKNTILLPIYSGLEEKDIKTIAGLIRCL